MIEDSGKKNKFLTNAKYYLISNILSSGIQFAYLPILTRYFTPVEYGQFAVFQIMIVLLSPFISLNVVSVSGFYYFDKSYSGLKYNYLSSSCLQIVIFNFIIILSIIHFFKINISQILVIDSRWPQLAVIISFLTVINQFQMGQWQIKNNSKCYAIFQVVQNSLAFFVTLVCVVLLGQGVWGRIAGQIVGVGLLSVISFSLLKMGGMLQIFIWNKFNIKTILSYGVPLIPHVIGMMLLMFIDRIVININLGPADAGIYSLAFQLSLSVCIIFDSINNAFVPWLFNCLNRDSYIEKVQIVRRTYLWFFVILVGSILCFFIFPPLVVMIAGKNFANAGELVGLLVLGQGFGGMYLMVTNYMFYSKRTGVLSMVTFISGILHLLLLIVFLNIYSLKGAALSFVISMACRFLLVWIISNKCYAMPWLYFCSKKL